MVIVYLFPNEHGPPHFHAKYGEQEVVIKIETSEVLQGSIAPARQRLVLAWARQRHLELQVAWDNLRRGEDPGVIEPPSLW